VTRPREALEVTLQDSTRVRIRPIRPSDRYRLQEGLRQLSPESRYLRFHSAVDKLTEVQLTYLTEIDYHDHMAWVALNVDDRDEPGMGVARYIRLPNEPDVAEAAITVADRYQGRGLGSVLLAVLCRSAIENGIRTLRNYVLEENQAVIGLFEELGATREREGPGVYRIDIPLPEDPTDLPDTPATKILRAAAKRRVPPFRELLGRFGPRAEDYEQDEDFASDIERELRQR
jgi:RimJ/RimL family protein N-acetyltransferase